MRSKSLAKHALPRFPILGDMSSEPVSGVRMYTGSYAEAEKCRRERQNINSCVVLRPMSVFIFLRAVDGPAGRSLTRAAGGKSSNHHRSICSKS